MDNGGLQAVLPTGASFLTTPNIDHLVLPVESLVGARKRWQELGFTVAPDAFHPFGTSNACVFFSDGTYLEPLAVQDEALAGQSITAGNCFVEKDRTFRQAGAREGFSAFVLRSTDAVTDDERFRQSGISAGNRLDFSRTVVDENGSASVASFRLAFADLDSLSFFAFTCQRVNAALPTAGPSVEHRNGALGLGALFLATEGSRGIENLATMLGVHVQEKDHKYVFPLGNCDVEVAMEIAPELDNTPRYPTGLRGIGIRFRVRNIAETRSVLQEASIPHQSSGERLIIAPAQGQGCIVEFVQA
ncbi:VOC family protein [Rhizobium rhizoryzae]|uniref:VOC family protein n=1 Tax=Rhizobium rhizoryzae TaxID=451876 RepID=UPI0028A9C11D|nr:VOC family protein [Rhizobium rhizoryzae]